MKPKVLKTEAEYEAALAEIEALMDVAPGSMDEETLELRGLLVREYENEHYAVDLPDPIEAILFRMEQAGLRPKDLIPYIGSQSKVSEVLNRKRRLSLTMIQALQQKLGIPAAVLLQQPNRQLARRAQATKSLSPRGPAAGRAGAERAQGVIREETAGYSAGEEQTEQN